MSSPDNSSPEDSSAVDSSAVDSSPEDSSPDDISRQSQKVSIGVFESYKGASKTKMIQ